MGYRKYNPEEKVDHVKELTDKLEQGVKDIFANPKKESRFDDENFKKYLQIIAKFHNYSYNNCMLIAMQNPDATYVAGYKSWQNNFERHVKKGEKGIKILAPNPYNVKVEQNKLDPNTQKPMVDEHGNYVKEEVTVKKQSYRAVSVFDVSQTEGKELPRELSHFTKELKGDVADYEKIMDALKQISPVPIEYETLFNGSKGYFSPGEEKVVINTDMDQVQNVKTAIHEIAHAILHDPTKGTEKDSGLTRGAKEVQAESVAYTVCQHFGIDTSDYSFGYVANWSDGKEMNELKSSLETIRKTASEFITAIEEKISEMELLKEGPDLQTEKTKIDLTKDAAKQQEMEYVR